MQAVVTSERRFVVGSDGQPCCRSGTQAYGFWRRYLSVFDRVTVVGRQSLDTVMSGHCVEGPGVTFFPLADCRGLGGMVARHQLLRRQIAGVCDGPRAFILRVPGMIGELARRQLTRNRTPFAVEVVGDPRDVFAVGAVNHPLRLVLQRIAIRYQQRQCRQATAAAYVTRRALQRRYPPGPNTLATNYSSIDLDRKALTDSPRSFCTPLTYPRLVTVGTFQQRYKAHHILIAAVARLAETGRPCRLELIGDGGHRAEMQSLAHRFGIAAHVRFLGGLPAGAAVRARLDQADLFVMPSLAEGLPRAMIEAMARGLPCLGTAIGGIPELLEPGELVPAADVVALAQAIAALADNPERLTHLSAENLAKARAYRRDVLQQRRDAFYRYVAERSHGADARRQPKGIAA